MNKHKKGFTLIELLVVVAIISLLASVILASLSDARAKAKDSVLKQETLEFQKLMELDYDDAGMYTYMLGFSNAYPDGCAGNGWSDQAVAICENIVNNSPSAISTAAEDSNIVVQSSDESSQDYTIAVILNKISSSGDPTYFCVRSDGTVSETEGSYSCAPE